MTEYANSWAMSRQRFVDEIKGLNAEQLNWKIHPGALSIGEMALHVAGVEIYFIGSLTKRDFSDLENKIAACAKDSVVNDNPFPFSVHEITPESVITGMDHAKSIVEPVITNPSQEVREGTVVSVLGPTVSGDGVFTRLAFHSAYHQGQAYTYKTSPSFPK